MEDKKEIHTTFENDNFIIDFKVNNENTEEVWNDNIQRCFDLFYNQEDEDNPKKVIQINFNKFKTVPNDNVVNSIKYRDKDTGIVLSDMMARYDVNMELLNKMDLNEIKKDEGLKYLYLFIARINEYKELIESDELLRQVSEKIKEIDKELANEN